MSMKNTAIGIGIGVVIWRLFGGIFSLVFLIFLVVLWINPDPIPKPTFSERQTAHQVEEQEQLAKPNILITSFEKAIADRNVPEIDRLWSALIHHFKATRITGTRRYLVARDVERMLKILKTCPIELTPTKQRGIDMMIHSRSQAQERIAERRLHENRKETYRLKKEIRNRGG